MNTEQDQRNLKRAKVRERVIDVFIQHETTYQRVDERDGNKVQWKWECKCGEKDALGTWEDCHKRTREHWTDAILKELHVRQIQWETLCIAAAAIQDGLAHGLHKEWGAVYRVKDVEAVFDKSSLKIIDLAKEEGVFVNVALKD